MQQFRALGQQLNRARTSTAARQQAIASPTVSTSNPTPIYISQRMRWVIIGAAFLAVIWLFTLAPGVLRLLLIGSTVALVLSFPVRLLQKWMPRNLSILVVVGSTVAVAIFGLILLVPYAISEIAQFVEQLPAMIDRFEVEVRNTLMEFYRRGWIQRHPDIVIEDAQGTLLNRGEVIVGQLLNNAMEALTRTFSIAITTFGVIFIATYLLIDIPKFKTKFVQAFSPAYRPDATQLWNTLGTSLSRYLSGLMLSIVIQGVMAAVALTVLNVPYAIVLGVWMSATAILPYVGAFLGGIPAVLVALTISWEMAVIVTLVYVAINQIEGNLITPRVQGTAVRVHPLLIFVSVIGGSQIAGPLGAILAVPTLAVVRVLIEFLWERLQVKEAQVTDTVLVALGGDDDERIAVATTAGSGSLDAPDISVDTDGDGHVSVQVDQGASVGDTPPTATGYRPRPTVRRRMVARKHRPAQAPKARSNVPASR